MPWPALVCGARSLVRSASGAAQCSPQFLPCFTGTFWCRLLSTRHRCSSRRTHMSSRARRRSHQLEGRVGVRWIWMQGG
jgi:hypothetical protein